MSEKVTIADFGIFLMAALRLRGLTLLRISDDITQLHEAFEKAFQVVSDRFGETVLDFTIILDRTHGTSAHVDTIMYGGWLGLWATNDAPGTTWRFKMSEEAACRVFERHTTNQQYWLEAADAFIAHLRAPALQS